MHNIYEPWSKKDSKSLTFCGTLATYYLPCRFSYVFELCEKVIGRNQNELKTGRDSHESFHSVLYTYKT